MQPVLEYQRSVHRKRPREHVIETRECIDVTRASRNFMYLFITSRHPFDLRFTNSFIRRRFTSFLHDQTVPLALGKFSLLIFRKIDEPVFDFNLGFTSLIWDKPQDEIRDVYRVLLQGNRWECVNLHWKLTEMHFACFDKVGDV